MNITHQSIHHTRPVYPGVFQDEKSKDNKDSKGKNKSEQSCEGIHKKPSGSLSESKVNFFRGILSSRFAADKRNAHKDTCKASLKGLRAGNEKNAAYQNSGNARNMSALLYKKPFSTTIHTSILSHPSKAQDSASLRKGKNELDWRKRTRSDLREHAV